MSQKRIYFARNAFMFEVLNALIQSAIITIIPLAFMGGKDVMDYKGRSADFASVSITIYSLVVFTTSLVIFMRVGNINIMTVSFIVSLSLVPYFGFVWIYNYVAYFNIHSTHTTIMLFSSPIFYLIVVVTMSMIFGIEYFYAFTRFWVYPTMREYGLVLRKKKLVHDDRFFEKGLVASIKSIFNPLVIPKFWIIKGTTGIWI